MATHFEVLYKGPTELKYDFSSGVTTVLSVEGKKWLKFSSNKTECIKTFLFQVIHSVSLDGNQLSFTYIDDHDRRNAYTFEFVDAETRDAFIPKLPERLLQNTGMKHKGSHLLRENAAIAHALADEVDGGGGGGGGGGSTCAGAGGDNGGPESHYEELKKTAANATGDHSHLSQNRTERHVIKTKVRHPRDESWR